MNIERIILCILCHLHFLAARITLAFLAIIFRRYKASYWKMKIRCNISDLDDAEKIQRQKKLLNKRLGLDGPLSDGMELFSDVDLQPIVQEKLQQTQVTALEVLIRNACRHRVRNQCT